MQYRSTFLIILIGALILLVQGQGCSSGTRFSLNEITGFKSQQSGGGNGNGTGYDGKLRVLHHYVDDFKCEGRPQPEGILIRDQNLNWVQIQNKSDKCGYINRQPVQNVNYDETLQHAYLDGKLYVPPREYYVSAQEDPNLAPLFLDTGVCEDANGRCSLRAAIEQSATTSLTAPVVIHIPAATYRLTSSLNISDPFNNGQSITIRGEDPNTTILDGGNVIVPLRVSRLGVSLFKVENVTVQNGFRSDAPNGSAIGFGWSTVSAVELTNCIFATNKSSPAVSATSNLKNFLVRRSQFLHNENVGLSLMSGGSVVIEDSLFDGNFRGLDNSAHDVILRRSTIVNSTNFGILSTGCESCQLENITIADNQSGGVWILSQQNNLKFSILNSTIFRNWGSEGNLRMEFSGTGQVFLRNSIVANESHGNGNCSISNSTANQNFISQNNLFDDTTCGTNGAQDLIAAPLLGPLGMNGGWTPTFLLQSGSPAIDSGSNLFCPATDQRGLPRPVDKLGSGATCDRGAVELQ